MKDTIFNIIRKTIFGKLFFSFETELERQFAGCGSVLDIGCGKRSPIANIVVEANNYVGIDAHKESLDQAKKNYPQGKYYLMDSKSIKSKFKQDSFDCVVAIDLIEHLEKNDGFNLIKNMENIARQKILIFTPNGFLSQNIYDGNELQIHRSGWNFEELKRMGYIITGVNGLKNLRGERAKSKIHPKEFGELLSAVTQIFIKHHPKYAFQLLAVKEKSRGDL